MQIATRLSAAIALAGCVACSPPVTPPDDKPPEPQASAPGEAIRAPVDKAKAVGDTAQAAARQRLDAADAATSP